MALRIEIPKDAEDALADILWQLGSLGWQTDVNTQGWLEILAYFDDASPAERVRRALTPLGATRCEATPVPQVDWVARFREGFRAFDVGRFRVTPPWDSLPSETDPRWLLVVDPGQAFGTGTHETTRLCLQALAELAGRAPLGRVLDLGAGTALLAIAALRLGASCAVASDIDPDAIAQAVHHMRLNRGAVRVVCSDGARAFRAGTFDLIVANLTATLLLERKDEILACARGRARLVLSGVLQSDLPDVSAAFAPAGRVEARTDGEWACLLVGSAAP